MALKLPDSCKPIVITILLLVLISISLSVYLNRKHFDLLDMILFPLVVLWGSQHIYAYLFGLEIFATGATEFGKEGFSNRGAFFVIGIILVGLSFYGAWNWGER